MPATASAQLLACAPPSCCSPASHASSSAEVFHTLSTYSESRTGFFYSPKRRTAPLALTSAHSFPILSVKTGTFRLDLNHLHLQGEFYKWEGGEAEHAYRTATRYQLPHHSLRLFIPYHNNSTLPMCCLLFKLFCLQIVIISKCLGASTEPTLSTPFLCIN